MKNGIGRYRGTGGSIWYRTGPSNLLRHGYYVECSKPYTPKELLDECHAIIADLLREYPELRQNSSVQEDLTEAQNKILKEEYAYILDDLRGQAFNKVKAVKALRVRAGVGLKDAVTIVNRVMAMEDIK